MIQHVSVLHKDGKTLCETVNSKLKEVCYCFKASKLSLNAKKANLMFLGTRFQTKNIDGKAMVDYGVYLDGCKISLVEEGKFLGVTVDDNLTWEKW